MGNRIMKGLQVREVNKEEMRDKYQGCLIKSQGIILLCIDIKLYTMVYTI